MIKRLNSSTALEVAEGGQATEKLLYVLLVCGMRAHLLIEPPRHIKRCGGSHLHNIHATQSITCRLLFSRGKQAGGMRFRWSSGAVDARWRRTPYFFAAAAASLPQEHSLFYRAGKQFVSYYTA